MRALITVLLVIALLFAVSKWIIWRLSFMAVLGLKQAPDLDPVDPYDEWMAAKDVAVKTGVNVRLFAARICVLSGQADTCMHRNRAPACGTDDFPQ